MRRRIKTNMMRRGTRGSTASIGVTGMKSMTAETKISIAVTDTSQTRMMTSMSQSTDITDPIGIKQKRWGERSERGVGVIPELSSLHD
jgi:hypothetical protein